MGNLEITLNAGTEDEVTLGFIQALTLKRLMEEHPGSYWHKQECDCCICLHPGGDKSKGYIIGPDGDYELVQDGSC